MKSIRRRIPDTRYKLSESERFAMQKEWVEFLLRKRVTNCLLALICVIALTGVAFAGVGAGNACVATTVILLCIARILNTFFRSTRRP